MAVPSLRWYLPPLVVRFSLCLHASLWRSKPQEVIMMRLSTQYPYTWVSFAACRQENSH